MGAPLPCPACRAEMIEVESAAALDICPDCQGLWLDAGELEREGAALPGDLVAVSAERHLDCPRCRAPLATFRGALAEVDLCERCGGAFLDPGELEVLVEARRLGTAEAPAAFTCQACGREAPLEEQVVGEEATLCAPCAERAAVRAAPARRRERLRAPRPATNPVEPRFMLDADTRRRNRPTRAQLREAGVEGSSGRDDDGDNLGLLSSLAGSLFDLL